MILPWFPKKIFFWVDDVRREGRFFVSNTK